MRTVDYLFISYASLPLPRPRSYQVTKLLKHLKGTFLLITCEHSKAENLDFSMASYLKTVEESTLRVKDRSQCSAARMLFNIIPATSQFPDNHLMWIPSVTKMVKRLKAEIRPRVIVAVSRPETDLLIGMKLKKLLGIPLVAYFSDPWADKPYPNNNRFMKWANSRMEAKVINQGDLILFTNEDQQNLVMQKYPEYIQRKAKSVKHCYDEELYPRFAEKERRFVVRHMGRLFKYRSPEPFLKAMDLIVRANPDIERKLLVEFFGEGPVEVQKCIEKLSLGHIVKLKASVPYVDSLKLMSSADLLLLIDAESKHDTFYNTFFPSKLVDYMGAKNNILGIASENSPSGRIIKSYGGQVFSNKQVHDIAEYLLTAIRDYKPFQPNISELKKYDARKVASDFENLCSVL